MTVCLVGGADVRTGTSEPRDRASWMLAASVHQAGIDHSTWPSRRANPHAYPPDRLLGMLSFALAGAHNRSLCGQEGEAIARVWMGQCALGAWRLGAHRLVGQVGHVSCPFGAGQVPSCQGAEVPHKVRCFG